MKKTKKILFPTDFSERASNAFRYALLLADKLEANIQLLHVIFPDPEPIDFPVLVTQATQMRLETTREQLAQFAEIGIAQLLQQLKKPPAILSNIELGTPSKVIASTAKSNEIDLIVMGTKGARNGLDKFLGSVASGVVKKASCAVIVVPENAAFHLEKIAYASDLNEADPFEIWKMVKLLDLENPKIQCLHFNRGTERLVSEPMEDLENFFAERSPHFTIEFHNLPGKDVIKNLNNFIEENNIQLVTMYQPSRSFFDNLFHRSSTSAMALETNVPLLVLKEA